MNLTPEYAFSIVNTVPT